MYETKPYFYGTGRRKDSVARVRVYQGTGKVTINDRDIDNYFGLETLKLIVRSPLVLLGLEGKYDVVVRVSGGGVSGQAGAIRHGLSRALLQQSDENRAALKKEVSGIFAAQDSGTVLPFFTGCVQLFRAERNGAALQHCRNAGGQAHLHRDHG